MKYIVFALIIISSTLISHQIYALQTKECTACHISSNGGPVKKPLTELCVGCHRERIETGEHKVDIIPRYQVPQNLPLTKDGKITCITCHDQHSAEYMMLRFETMVLCNKCHKK
ncbi:MAG: cytochrome c3 family protein [Nitrospirae bacterium]|nr:cytochrome c3 family protein [Nitrospirota bacterium]MBI3378335.1 cytochrome c3 family protein [Nitrospirota bacterium]